MNGVPSNEVLRLKEEVEVLRNELQRAENELEDRAWFAPKMLQTWLQLTYELEAQTVRKSNIKKCFCVEICKQ